MNALTDGIQQECNKHIFGTYARFPVAFVRGEGCRLWDDTGKEYLDFLAGGDALIPADPKTRYPTLTKAALADGILDAALLLIYEERFRAPEQRVAKWTDHQAEKMTRGLAVFAAAPPSGRRDVAHIGLACVLGYLDLRFSGQWRNSHKNLVAWLAAFEAEVPAFAATRFVA